MLVMYGITFLFVTRSLTTKCDVINRKIQLQTKIHLVQMIYFEDYLTLANILLVLKNI